MTKSFSFAATAVLALSSQAPAQQPAPASPQANPHGNWVRADQTRQQAQQRADAMFQRLDANRDGSLTREEAQMAGPATGRGGGRVERLMGRLFGDAQSVTQAQFQAQALARFDRQDLNRDGVVTTGERQQARAARAAQRDD